MASSSSNFVSDSFLPLFLWNSISTDAKPSHRVTHFSSSHLHFSGLSSLWSAFLQACFPRSLPGSAVVTSEPDSAFFIVIIIYLISSFFSFIKNISSPSLPSLLLAINHSHLNILSDKVNPRSPKGLFLLSPIFPWFSFLQSYLLGLLTIYGWMLNIVYKSCRLS